MKRPERKWGDSRKSRSFGEGADSMRINWSIEVVSKVSLGVTPYLGDNQFRNSFIAKCKRLIVD